MAEQTNGYREHGGAHGGAHGAAGLTPTRLEVTESLHAADLEQIDEILGSPTESWDTGGTPAKAVEGAGVEDPKYVESIRMLLDDELDHAGLDEVEADTLPSPVRPLVEPKEHHPVKWGPVV